MRNAMFALPLAVTAVLTLSPPAGAATQAAATADQAAAACSAVTHVRQPVMHGSRVAIYYKWRQNARCARPWLAVRLSRYNSRAGGLREVNKIVRSPYWGSGQFALTSTFTCQGAGSYWAKVGIHRSGGKWVWSDYVPRLC